MKKRFRSPLDFTERQMQNLLTLVGLGILVYWSIIGFEPSASFLGAISMLMMGQRLIRIGRHSESDSDDNKVASRTERSNPNKHDGNLDSIDSNSSRRRLWFLGLPTGKRRIIL